MTKTTLRTFFDANATMVASNINEYLFSAYSQATGYATLFERAHKAGITKSCKSFRRHYDLWRQAKNNASMQTATA